jgi:hypothetical protein
VAKDAIHMVSAFAARQRMVLGQVKVADKAVTVAGTPRFRVDHWQLELRA